MATEGVRDAEAGEEAGEVDCGAGAGAGECGGILLRVGDGAGIYKEVPVLSIRYDDLGRYHIQYLFEKTPMLYQLLWQIHAGLIKEFYFIFNSPFCIMR